MTAPLSKSSLEFANHAGKGNNTRGQSNLRSSGTTSCRQPEDTARDVGRTMPLNRALPLMRHAESAANKATMPKYDNYVITHVFKHVHNDTIGLWLPSFLNGIHSDFFVILRFHLWEMF